MTITFLINRFDPDRFAPANRDKIIEMTYMPFGDGPRNCIGRLLPQITRITYITYITYMSFGYGPTKLDWKVTFWKSLSS